MSIEYNCLEKGYLDKETLKLTEEGRKIAIEALEDKELRRLAIEQMKRLGWSEIKIKEFLKQCKLEYQLKHLA